MLGVLAAGVFLLSSPSSDLYMTDVQGVDLQGAVPVAADDPPTTLTIAAAFSGDNHKLQTPLISCKKDSGIADKALSNPPNCRVDDPDNDSRLQKIWRNHFWKVNWGTLMGLLGLDRLLFLAREK